MKLLTEELKRRLPPLGATESTPVEEKDVIVKFFNPCGAATWYVFEGEPELDDDGAVVDWIFFAHCDLFGDGGEIGYVSLNELQSVRLPFGLRIERDLNIPRPWKFKDTPAGKDRENAATLARITSENW